MQQNSEIFHFISTVQICSIWSILNFILGTKTSVITETVPPGCAAQSSFFPFCQCSSLSSIFGRKAPGQQKLCFSLSFLLCYIDSSIVVSRFLAGVYHSLSRSIYRSSQLVHLVSPTSTCPLQDQAMVVLKGLLLFLYLFFWKDRIVSSSSKINIVAL